MNTQNNNQTNNQTNNQNTQKNLNVQEEEKLVKDILGYGTVTQKREQILAIAKALNSSLSPLTKHIEGYDKMPDCFLLHSVSQDINLMMSLLNTTLLTFINYSIHITNMEDNKEVSLAVTNISNLLMKFQEISSRISQIAINMSGVPPRMNIAN